MEYLLVILAGVVGVLLRLLVDRSFSAPASFPWAIFSVNVIGCLIAGLLAGSKWLSVPDLAIWRSALLVGFCGGLTTFSTYSLQAVDLINRGQFASAALYGLGSPLLGLLAAVAGLTVARLS